MLSAVVDLFFFFFDVAFRFFSRPSTSGLYRQEEKHGTVFPHVFLVYSTVIRLHWEVRLFFNIIVRQQLTQTCLTLKHPG